MPKLMVQDQASGEGSQDQWSSGLSIVFIFFFYFRVKITIYEGLTLEECWRLANLDNSQDSLQKAQLTFQVHVFTTCFL